MRIKRFLVIVVLTISLLLIYLGSALAQEDPPPPQNPVAVFLSEATEMTYDEIINLQKSGHGLGNIARAYNFVSATYGTLTMSDVLASRSQGIGWGQLYKEAGLKPGGGGQGLGWLLGKNKGANRSKHNRCHPAGQCDEQDRAKHNVGHHTDWRYDVELMPYQRHANCRHTPAVPNRPNNAADNITQIVLWF